MGFDSSLKAVVDDAARGFDVDARVRAQVVDRGWRQFEARVSVLRAVGNGGASGRGTRHGDGRGRNRSLFNPRGLRYL
jgi:hypothetical protein